MAPSKLTPINIKNTEDNMRKLLTIPNSAGAKYLVKTGNNKKGTALLIPSVTM
ncbi:hypothetical protein GCM10027516_18330 [Niabella aquatica]